MPRVPATLRSTLLAVTALWLATVGSGVSLVHSHDDGPGATPPHRHLILFGVECPAETLEDCDGLGAWHAPVDPPADPDALADSVCVAVASSSPPELPTIYPHVATDRPFTSAGSLPSPHAIRSAILRA